MLDSTSFAALRRRIDLPLARRASGLLDGAHQSLLQGHGEEFDDLSLYSPGDDVGDIDWKASARAGVPVIKRFETRRVVPVLLAVDTGRQMVGASAGGRPKSDVVRLAVAVLAQVALNRGDPVGLAAVDEGRVVRLPARTGQGHLQVVVRQVERAFDPAAPPSDLARLLHQATSLTRRGLVILVTDDAGPAPEHERALRRLRDRHEVMVVSVQDGDPFAPGPDGRPSRDVMDGWGMPTELVGSAELAGALEAYRTERRERRAAMLRRLQATDVVVRGVDDLVPALLAGARRRRARR